MWRTGLEQRPKGENVKIEITEQGNMLTFMLFFGFYDIILHMLQQKRFIL